jgi:ABC-type branched-subunit amino acid transport system ATPase component
VLAVRDLVKRFGGVTALDGVDLEVTDGESLGLIGPNGSGKTTLVNCVSGILQPTSGAIVFDGQDVSTWPRARRARAGLLRTFQNLRLFNELTVAENIEAGLSTGRSSHGGDGVHAVLEQLDLAHLARRRVADLPYGYQRRVEIARALIGRPRLLLLDEPAAGLSETERDELRDALHDAQRRLGTAMLVIDHDMTFIVDLCERIVALHEGRRIFSGAAREALTHHGVVESYLGGIAENARA